MAGMHGPSAPPGVHLGALDMDDAIWMLLDSSGMGGIESHVAELCAALAAAGRGTRVVFLADHGPHPLRARLGAAGVPWECLSGGPAALVRRLREGRPSVLHTHGYKAGVLGRLAARLAGVPVVSTFHAGEVPAGRVRLWDALDRWTSFLGVRLAVSRPILDRLPFGGRLAPNFVAIPVPASARPLPGTVAFVGRMSPEKGPDLFVRLAAAAPGPEYLAFGDGPERSACEAAAGGGVRFMGMRDGMADEWPGIGLLAITSRAEGLPLAALEAMANGVPVLAFAVGGLPDAIEDGVTGWLVPPGDVAAMADRVGRWAALSPHDRQAMSRAARARAEREFGPEAGVARVLEAYGAAPG